MSDDDGAFVGECPDLPARSGVSAVLGAAERVSAAVQAVAEIRALHSRPSVLGMSCGICQSDVPCLTMRIPEKWGLT